MARSRTAVFALGTGTALLLVGCTDQGERVSEARLAGAASECSTALTDEGRTLRITAGEGASCVFSALDLPDSVRSQVDSTSLVAGQRTADADGLRWTWTYSGFSGLDMVVQVAD